MFSWAVVFSLRITGLYFELWGFIFVATEVQKSALSVRLLYHIGSDEHVSVSVVSHSMWSQYFPFVKHTKVACRIYFSVGVTDQFPAVSALYTLSETERFYCVT